jgi:ribonuclease P protein component
VSVPPSTGGSPAAGARFPRTARLLNHADFERVYEAGKRHFSANLTAFYLPRSGGGGLRVGFTVSRALGGAVERNRIRRRMREAVRLRRPEDGPAVDVVINPKKSSLKVEFTDLLQEVGKAFAVVVQKTSGQRGGS